eukprot:287571-Amphidinium_carterae.1
MGNSLGGWLGSELYLKSCGISFDAAVGADTSHYNDYHEHLCLLMHVVVCSYTVTVLIEHSYNTHRTLAGPVFGRGTGWHARPARGRRLGPAP